jgi:hypothetical protein
MSEASVHHILGIYETRLRMIEKGVTQPPPKVVDGVRQLVTALRKLNPEEKISLDATDDRWFFLRSNTGDLIAKIELK